MTHAFGNTFSLPSRGTTTGRPSLSFFYAVSSVSGLMFNFSSKTNANKFVATLFMGVTRSALTQHQKLACLSLNCGRRMKRRPWSLVLYCFPCPVSFLCILFSFSSLFLSRSGALEPGAALFKQTVSHSHKAAGSGSIAATEGSTPSRERERGRHGKVVRKQEPERELGLVQTT